MKIVKTLLYILIIINIQANANQIVIEANSNIWNQFEVDNDMKWSLNGGVFQEKSTPISIQNNGNYDLILMDSDGVLESFSFTVINGSEEKFSIPNTIFIDNKAPDIKYRWENVINQNNQVTVGPNSLLFWDTDDSNALVNILVNNKSVELTSPMQMTANVSTISINATDNFNNQSQNQVIFHKQFDQPQISWKLKPPAFFLNNQWYAHKTAQLVFENDNGFNYSINNKRIDPNNNVVEILNNSELTVQDKLGNQKTTKISWLADKMGPQFIVQTLGKSHINPQKMAVKVGQKIHIKAEDDIGLMTAEYGNRRNWSPLPRTFVFVDTGLYRLYIKATDKIGNTEESYVVFKITK